MRFAIFLSFSFIVATICLGQIENNTRVPLNKHYFEVGSGDTSAHFYTKLVSYSADSTKIERIFTLDRKLARIVKTSPKKEDFHQSVIEEYSASDELLWRETYNLANSKYLRTYFQDGQQVAQVMHRGENKYSVFRKGDSKARETLYDDFIPSPIETKHLFGSFMSRKVSFGPGEIPSYRHMLFIAIFVDESGQVTEIEWANPLGAKND